MADDVKAVRRVIDREARMLERLNRRLWAADGRLSACAGDGGHPEAERLAGLLGCILVDRLAPALAALRAALSQDATPATVPGVRSAL
jgi:hypothetical protein